MTDDTKKQDPIIDVDSELDEEGEGRASVEPDFAPSSSAPLEDLDNEDPHESFNPIVPHEEDLHVDPYGVGAPSGFGDEDSEDEPEDDEELEEEVGDSFSY